MIFGFHFYFPSPSRRLRRRQWEVLLLLLSFFFRHKNRCVFGGGGVHVYCLRDEAICNFWVPVILIFFAKIFRAYNYGDDDDDDDVDVGNDGAWHAITSICKNDTRTKKNNVEKTRFSSSS